MCTASSPPLLSKLRTLAQMKFLKSILPVTKVTEKAATVVVTGVTKLCPFFAHHPLLLVHQRNSEEASMKNSSIRLIRMPEVLSKTGFKKSWIYLLVSNNSFPKPIKVGARAIAFVEAEIDEWVEERINESRINNS